MAGKGKKSERKKKSARKAQDDLFGAINQVARSTRGLLARQLAASGLYAGQDALMLALDTQDGQTPSQIATRLGVRAPTITKTINRLAEKGFVRKSASEIDGRLAHVHLTEEGRAVIEAIRAAVEASETLAVEGLSGKDVKTLVKLLRKVDRNLHSPQGADIPDKADAGA